MPQFVPEHTPVSVDDFVRGYLDCAEWLLDEEIDRSEVLGWSLEAINRAAADCAEFQRANASNLADYCGILPSHAEYSNEERAGHDFFLTRNGHGTGFWDRGLGELGERLSEASKAIGSADVYLGDDKFLYFM